MNNRFVFVLGLLVIIWFSASAQTGNYFISHYSPNDERIDFRSHDMAQDNHGELYFANKAGVLEFDGFDWNVISVPGAVYTLATNGTEVLIGGLTGVGKLNEKIQTPRSYDVISQASGFFSSTYYDNKAYLCSDNQLIIYALTSHLVEATLTMNAATGNFQGVFQVGNDIVVSTKKNGLFKVQGNTLIPFEFALSNIIFSNPSPLKKSFLIGTKDNRIFILTDGQLKEVILQQSNFLSHNILADGVWASEHVLALGTKRSGVIFINAQTGATDGMVDYANGLPDNEVFSLMKDRNDGVWVAHEYGFSRIATNLPFRSFHHYPGLQGNLLCVQSFQDHVYVGTTLGLFTLVPVGQQTIDQKQNLPAMAIATNASLLSNTQTQAYEYKKVNQVEGKVIQLVELNGNFMAYGSGGLYEVKGQSAKLILDEPVRNVYRSAALSQVLVSTTNDQIRTFISENQWEETHLLDTLENHFSYFFEDKLENVWLCGSTYIYKVEAVDGEILEILKYPVQNPTEDETLGLALGSEVYIVSSGQFKHFDGKGFVKYDSLSGGHRYFASAGSFWFNDGKKWRTVDRKIQSMKLEWLGIFPNLRFLSPDNKSTTLWAITDKNELYKFHNDQSDSSEALYPLFLREVQGNQVELKDQLEIDQSEGAFTFKFIRPDYIGAHATQYRYMVKGLNAQWSSWSASNNIIPFSFLPAGVYQLAVQSKNALGAESRIEEVAFEVLPPYWKRWWFFALEFFLFSFLVSISIQLARSNSRYRYISQVLTILTVIMLIQFIQTAIDSLIDIRSSPVVDFFIQVSIALLVLPVEIVARNAMQKVAQNKISVQRLFNSPEDL
jgi:ligand-binding sensor domain-containing protein